jgi:hypothetical protein
LCDQFQGEFFRSSSDGHQQCYNVNRRSNNNKYIGFSPTLFIDTVHHLSSQQLALLNRGPTYVPLCQMRTLLSSLPLKDILAQQYKPFHHQLNKFFFKYRVHLGRSTNFLDDIREQFMKNFFKPLPTSIQQQALNEKKLVQSIRRQFKKDNLILRRTADEQNIFYLGCADDFERQANDFINKTKTYEVIVNVDTTTKYVRPEQHPYVLETIERIDTTLKTMQKNHQISTEQLTKLCVNKSNMELPYLYFLPEINKVCCFNSD